MSMDMEKLSLTIIHPIIGSTAGMQGIVNIERNFIEDKSSWRARAVDGLRIVKKFKDPNCDIVVTTLRGSDIDYALNRALLYPKTVGSCTWTDERIEGKYKGGTGVLESIDETTTNTTDENAVYTLRLTNYTGS
ncbi:MULTISPECIES: hypothetical protein [Fusobacterium]|jgi:hypothetical protein|uniref:hypothetical protein n=1 Tax=Fusobacterium TaxID=848 RepID=UPI000E9489AB|nr:MULTISPECIES: hypothetical protein [Fusobacterium]DAE77849.1 MAG TPA: hypothetical protein [Caudoviricetes sp.]HBJ79731.1 hypothetical protein [Fusobacterium sp.]